MGLAFRTACITPSFEDMSSICLEKIGVTDIGHSRKKCNDPARHLRYNPTGGAILVTVPGTVKEK